MRFYSIAVYLFLYVPIGIIVLFQLQFRAARQRFPGIVREMVRQGAI